ncbi:hypothetical protein [Flavobacterium sp. ZB4P13]|uniref:hypothetical protein n=1 Tax=Flavobacterium sp. ZB4P13 TaxID=3401728 RepID=UPI003AAB55A7
MTFKSILPIISSLLILSCEKQNLCDEGYKPHEQNGQTICIPDFLTGQTFDVKLGNTYYHNKYGVIVYDNGIWKNENNQIIKNFDK